MDGTSSTTKSKLFGGLYLLLAVIVLRAVIPSTWFKPKTQQQRPFTRIDFSSGNAVPSKITDTNSDGQISWGEAVSASLIDSTGTLDIIKDNPVDQKVIDQLNDPNNLTSSFSKNLFLATTQLRERGATDEATKQKTVAYLMEQEAAKIIQNKYALKDLSIETSETKATIKLYGNTVAPLVKDVLTKEAIESDLTSLAKYTQSLKESDLSPIIKNKVRVDALLQKMLLVKVPPSASSYHLLAVNRMAFYKETLESFSKMSEDPVRATLMFNSYQDTLLLLARIPSRFSQYFNSQNIVFGAGEAGYIFTTE
jgi:hypothetical protein